MLGFVLQVEKQSGGGDGSTPVAEEGLERGGTRSSIAERRRLYEKSMSVQEPVSPSPTPLRRRDSLKVTLKISVFECL